MTGPQLGAQRMGAGASSFHRLEHVEATCEGFVAESFGARVVACMTGCERT